MDNRHPIEALQEQGYRLTPQRMMVLDVIAHSGDHISAEEIYERVRDKYPHINISTIYRTLELLNQLGLITVTDMGEGCISCHYVDKGHHHHLICHRCGAKLELDGSFFGPLKKTLMREYGFQADLRHLAIFGCCQACQR